MRNKELFQEQIASFLNKLPKKIPHGMRIVALSGLVRTNESFSTLGSTQLFTDDQLDVDPSILAEKIGMVTLPYVNDNVYLGMSLLIIPKDMLEKLMSIRLGNITSQEHVDKLLKHDINSVLDLLLLDKLDLKNCGFSKKERGDIFYGLHQNGFNPSGLRNPKMPTPQQSPMIDILLQFMAA